MKLLAELHEAIDAVTDTNPPLQRITYFGDLIADGKTIEADKVFNDISNDLHKFARIINMLTDYLLLLENEK